MTAKWKALAAGATLLGLIVALWLWGTAAKRPDSYVALPPTPAAPVTDSPASQTPGDSSPLPNSPASQTPEREMSLPAKRDEARTSSPMTDTTTTMRMLSTEEANEYVGDRVCAECHKDIHGQQSTSRHARTLRTVSVAEDGAAFRLKQTVKDSLSGYNYQTSVKDGQCLIEGKSLVGGGSLPANYVMGSGRNARTYFNSGLPNAWAVLRLSYYNKERKWDFTPAQHPGEQLQQHPRGTLKVGSDLVGCLLCHVTVLRAGPTGPDIQNSDLGIGCERCHGPGRPHVEQDRPMERLGEASPDRINQLCGACHHDASNSPLSDPRTQNGMARFEGVALPLSKCFQESKTLSCLTCHNPHTDADPSPKNNDAKCLSCHAVNHAAAAPKVKAAQSASKNQKHTVCPVNPKAGCVHCHMPAQVIATIPHAQYHNHWIKVWAQGAAKVR